jgi:hypothetical protein
MTGMHGMGVSTPIAAAVAVATWGLAMDVHMANGMMLTIGMLSIMVAAGKFEVITSLSGNTCMELGAVPKLHCKTAVLQTCNAIRKTPSI